MKYRSKPEVVDAVQYDWSERTMAIDTRDGSQVLWPGDWCITHPDGTASVMTPKVFALEYEKVE